MLSSLLLCLFNVLAASYYVCLFSVLAAPSSSDKIVTLDQYWHLLHQDMCLKGHIYYLYLSHFLLQDSCKFPSNFLVQYRAEFSIEFTLSAIHVTLTFPGITHMMKIILSSFGILNLRKSLGNLNFPYLFLIHYMGYSMLFCLLCR